MKIQFLGSGSAFVLPKENFQSNVLIIADDIKGSPKLLFDAGTQIAESLDYHGINPEEINTVFISHNHSDHNGGVEYIGFKRYFGTYPFGQNVPTLLGHSKVLTELWNGSLKGGMSRTEGKTMKLDDYFHVHSLHMGAQYDFYGIECLPISMIHVKTDKDNLPSFGMLFMYNNKQIFLSGDTQFTPKRLKKIYNTSDIIFHECEFAEYDNSVHCQYRDLITLPDNVKAKMWLYHYSDNGNLPDVMSDGFAGLVTRGQTFTF